MSLAAFFAFKSRFDKHFPGFRRFEFVFAERFTEIVISLFFCDSSHTADYGCFSAAENTARNRTAESAETDICRNLPKCLFLRLGFRKTAFHILSDSRIVFALVSRYYYIRQRIENARNSLFSRFRTDIFKYELCDRPFSLSKMFAELVKTDFFGKNFDSRIR